MPSRSDLEIKSRLALGLGLLSLVVVLLLRLLLPLLALAGLGAMGFWLWRSHHQKQQHKQRQQARIKAMFYQLLKQQQGRISVLDFAMRTQLDGAAAQAYLNTQAQVFSAFFETTPQGDLIYVFGAAAVRSHAAQGKAVWAYSEQPRQTYSAQQLRDRARGQATDQAVEHAVERARAEQARAEQGCAQRNAKIEAQRNHAEKTQHAWNNAKQIRTLRQLAKNERLEIYPPTHQPALIGSSQAPTGSPQTEQASLTAASSTERKPQLPIADTLSRGGSSRGGSSRAAAAIAQSSPYQDDSPSRLPQRIITIDVTAVQG